MDARVGAAVGLDLRPGDLRRDRAQLAPRSRLAPRTWAAAAQVAFSGSLVTWPMDEAAQR